MARSLPSARCRLGKMGAQTCDRWKVLGATFVPLPRKMIREFFLEMCRPPRPAWRQGSRGLARMRVRVWREGRRDWSRSVPRLPPSFALIAHSSP